MPLPRPPRVALLPALLFVGIATIAAVMPVHNDTWWHLRAGMETWQRGSVLLHDEFSHTVPDTYFWNHSWLSQVAMYLLFRIGGLPLLTLFCAVLVSGAWLVVWRLTRGPLADRVLLMALAIAGSTTIWSVRPQVFSVALFPVVVALVARDRWVAIVLLIVVWANLHAGVAVIAVVFAASVTAAVLSDRDRLVQRCIGSGIGVVATLLTPLGVRNWTELVASMERSRANQIQEWMSTPWPPQQLIFWGMAAVLLVHAARRWRRLGSPEDRFLVVLSVLMAPAAVRALRNVPAFLMTAAPALSRLLWSTTPDAAQPADARHARAGLVTTAVAAVVAAVVVAVAWAMPAPHLGWMPVSDQARSAIAGCRPPLYNTYAGGGPLIWFVPDQPVFLDSRQDPYPTALVQAATRTEATGDYRDLFERYGINCAALPPQSPTVRALARDGWHERFSDGQWVVMERTDE